MNQVYSLQQLFENKVFQVPDYQRGYAWEGQQWNELLEDLEFLAPSKDHYTGNLVLDRQKGTVADKLGKKHELFHIVDGQQRLTTVVLLLDAIRERLLPVDPVLARGIGETYISFPDRVGETAYKLRLNSDCQEYFAKNVIADSPGPQGPDIASHERLRDARAHFRDYLGAKSKELGSTFQDWVEGLYDKITQRLKVGQYIVSDTTEVGVIFEVMNNRGKQLSELEKVKNYLLYVASKLEIEGHDLAERINDTWTEIFRRLMAAGLNDAGDEDRLLRAHWLMAYDPAKKGWNGSKSIKARFDLRDFHDSHPKLLAELGTYVRSLKDSVLVFAEIYAPNKGNTYGAFDAGVRSDVREWATKFTRVGAMATFLPILMATRLRKPKDADAYLEVLKLCELFSFRVYRWGSRRADAGQTRLFRLGFDLFHEEASLRDVSGQMRMLARRYSPDGDFEAEFEDTDEYNFYRWSGLRYFLYEYELHLANGRGVKLTWERLQEAAVERTIEHILPQTPKDEYWRKRFTAESRRQLTHALGNLTLTFDNSSYGAKAYPLKRGEPDQDAPCYYGSLVLMERKIAKDFEDWDDAAIRKRTEEIKAWAVKRWHIKTSDLPKEDEAGDVEEDETD